ncbi:tRNA (guanine-N(7)-)-methyltransferase [Vittaforma corneae ATCC 50505]|uniref:tRNA (guanine-N(7)-)-methyltransferase n=1 Tax=Vittaforma corneae (strain ATCC 50505) TaxID=993615 RepID=L2GNH5_VITCO|nr:tRNA (guanine-N(7)-)-methyltransferase [Vittaforma corneae ATCC 50505]ELA41872.1 tRNA (guanine-N(7)-)-methyltransferase [Vittaforma corneae ATCC 50505]
MVSKRDYRCHAHTNPFRDTKIDVPKDPSSIDWRKHFENGRPPTFIDVGCGYGKFLVETARLFPGENVLGLEIRDKVVEYVEQLVSTLPNCSVVQTNALLFLPNFFVSNSLRKVFVLFPDPHFKKRKQKFRMICRQTMAVLKYLFEKEGQLYISTDVEELFEDMCQVIESTGYFSEQKDPSGDPLFEKCYRGTDEAGRAGMKSGHTFGKVYKIAK